MEMMKIIPYSGVGVIGGNKIEVSEGSTRMLLDWGRSLGVEQLYRLGFNTPSELYEKIALGICPRLKGIYRKDLLKRAKLASHKEVAFDGIAYSHSHVDHFGDMYLLDPDIEHYMTSMTEDGIKAYENSIKVTRATEYASYRQRIENGLPSQHFQHLGNFQLIPVYGEKSFKIVKCDKKSLLKHPERIATHEAQILYNKIDLQVNRKFITGDKATIGEFEVEFIPVNHSIHDANSILLRSKDKTIWYSGDMQGYTGRYRSRNLRIIERLQEEKIDLALVDCTRIEQDTVVGEEAVENLLTDYLKTTLGMSFITFPLRDLKRYYTVLKACRRAGKTLVTYPKAAIYWMYKGIRRVLLEKYGLNYGRDIHVYELNSKYSSRQRNSINSYKSIKIIPDNEIDDQFLVHIHPLQIVKILDFKIPAKSKWIHSQSGPYDEEGEIEKQKILNYLRIFGIEWVEAHTSGHMGFLDMKFQLEKIKPRLIAPIHCELINSLKLKRAFPDKTVLLEIGKPFEF